MDAAAPIAVAVRSERAIRATDPRPMHDEMAITQAVGLRHEARC